MALEGGDRLSARALSGDWLGGLLEESPRLKSEEDAPLQRPLSQRGRPRTRQLVPRQLHVTSSRRRLRRARELLFRRPLLLIRSETDQRQARSCRISAPALPAPKAGPLLAASRAFPALLAHPKPCPRPSAAGPNSQSRPTQDELCPSSLFSHFLLRPCFFPPNHSCSLSTRHTQHCY